MRVKLLPKAMLATVYRIQDKEKRGPWRPGFSHKWVEDRPDAEYEALKPIMHDLPNAMHARGGLCACRSLSQLKRWVTDSEYQTLFGYGYRCVRITNCEVIAESDIQIVVRLTGNSKTKRVRYLATPSALKSGDSCTAHPRNQHQRERSE